MRAVRYSFLVLAIGVCLGGQAQATTMVYVPIEQLYQMSDVVVRGTVRSHTSFWGDDGQLLTDWTVQVDEVLYGEPVEQVTVRQAGGEIEDVRMWIPGDAVFSDGEHVVIFLVEADGVHYLAALGQAKLTVSLHGDFGVPGGVQRRPFSQAEAVDEVNATLIRDLSNIAFFRPEQGDLHSLENELLTLDGLRAMSPSFAEPASQGGAQ